MNFRKAALMMILLGAFLWCSGCETAKGMAKDVKNTWQSVLKADEWFKENLW